MPKTSEGTTFQMVRMEECDRQALAFAVRILNMLRDGKALQAGDVFRNGASVPNQHATVINLDRMREDFDNASDSEIGCDDPGAHRPGCQCNGGEPLL